jgi:hypothetical protein
MRPNMNDWDHMEEKQLTLFPQSSNHYGSVGLGGWIKDGLQKVVGTVMKILRGSRTIILTGGVLTELIVQHQCLHGYELNKLLSFGCHSPQPPQELSGLH